MASYFRRAVAPLRDALDKATAAYVVEGLVADAPEKDPYAALGVARDADEDTIRKAYRKLARRFHPDVNPDDATAEERFKTISEAYAVLSDEEKRRAYDEFGEIALDPGFDGHSNCFIETGDGKAMLIDFNYETEPLPGKFPLPGVGPFTLLGESEINHWGKLAFRWLYWNALLPGKPLPVPNRMSLVGKKSAALNPEITEAA